MSAIITVVIPVYNGEKYVRRAVESVVNQPEKDAVQVLIINDGSKDQSGAICDRLAEDYPNVRVIHKENGGVSSARNLGIQNVTTKYVAFLDCDDWWAADFLDTSLVEEFCNVNSADIYEFSYQLANNSCSLVKTNAVENKDLLFTDFGLGRYDWRHPCAFVYAYDLLKANGVQYPIAKVGEDGPFVEMALFHAKSQKLRNRIIFVYWENLSSCLHTSNILVDTKERHKAFLQEEQYLKQYSVSLDANCSFVWRVASNLPRICAENDYQTVVGFMDKECLPILLSRPDIHFRDELQNRLVAWQANPKRFWIRHRILLGCPIYAKKLCLRIPGVNRIVNYLFNRYYRGFHPIKKQL